MFKKFTKFVMLMAFAVMASVSCEKVQPDTPEELQLEVNANNISGRWALVLLDGQELLEGTFLHMEFIRNEKKFIITDGMQGFGDAPKTFDGRFDFEYDLSLGTILIGMYDHDSGLWNDKYIVESLTETTLQLKGVKSGTVQIFSKMKTEEK